MTVRRPAAPQRTDDTKRRADELHERGLPFQLAMAVAQGRLELNEALERMARKDQVNKLMAKHDLSRALATQVSLGHADLEQVLSRRRLTEHRELHRDWSCLQPGHKTVLTLRDRRLKGEVVSNGSYNFVFREDGAEAEEEIHKLEAVYAYEPNHWKKVRKGIKKDKAVAAQSLRPAERPQDRYGCSDKRLFRYLDADADVVVTTLTGELLRGKVGWFSRYEFCLQLKTGVPVVIFRHALLKIGTDNG